MSLSLEQRMAQIMREHSPLRNLHGGYVCNGKGCNAAWSQLHVAQEIVAEMNLVTRIYGVKA